MTVHVPVLSGFLVSLCVAGLLVATRRKHTPWTADHPSSGPQKLHDRPIPRVGGVAVAIGFIAALLITKFGTGPGQDIATPFALVTALLVPFIAGLYEDVTKDFGVTARLLATFVAAAIAFQWAGATIVRFDMPMLDAMLAASSFAPFLLTLFCVGGVAHAFNLADGLNGLLAGLSLVACGLIAYVARTQGDVHVYLCACALAGAIAGFAVFNFPRARLFAGDSGAYFIGTAIALLAILLVARNKAVTPWIAFVAVIYPFTDTTFAIVRRAVQRRPIMAPDAEHLHSLLAKRLLLAGSSHAHEVASLAIIAAAAACALVASMFAESAFTAIVVCALFAAGYTAAWFACASSSLRAQTASMSAHTQPG